MHTPFTSQEVATTALVTALRSESGRVPARKHKRESESAAGRKGSVDRVRQQARSHRSGSAQRP